MIPGFCPFCFSWSIRKRTDPNWSEAAQREWNEHVQYERAFDKLIRDQADVLFDTWRRELEEKIGGAE